jgi:NAD(P)-dependent dehydrogenase (short-subunit alcohol dehydrogenase family)
MRDLAGRNRTATDRLGALSRSEGTDLRVTELDVRSQASADAAVATVIAEAGRLDVVVHNAGHMSLGYTEAYTAEEVADLLDVNALSAQRVNRAALPHLRAQGAGTLVSSAAPPRSACHHSWVRTSSRSSPSTRSRRSPRTRSHRSASRR